MKSNTVELCKLLIICLLAAGLTACATTRASFKDAQANHTVSFASARDNPTQYKDAKVLWGGEIQNVINGGTNGTELIVREIPLYALGKAPIYGGKSEGMFMARSHNGLDPKLFQPGEIITTTGRITGQGTTGPEMQIETVRFWELQRQPDLSEQPLYTDDYPFDTRPEPVTGWTFHYVLNRDMNQRVQDVRAHN
jgi:starvation-inducible outer membrane lipoprotein